MHYISIYKGYCDTTSTYTRAHLSRHITYCYKLWWGCTAFNHIRCAQSIRSRPYSITSAERAVFRNSTIINYDLPSITISCNPWRLVSLAKEFLSNRIQCAVVDGKQSQPAVVTSRVPQGTVLVSLLFFSFIKDLSDKITSIRYIYMLMMYYCTLPLTLLKLLYLKEDLNTFK